MTSSSSRRSWPPNAARVAALAAALAAFPVVGAGAATAAASSAPSGGTAREPGGDEPASPVGGDPLAEARESARKTTRERPPATVRGAATRDFVGPRIFVHPSAPVGPREPLVVTARIVDPAGVGRAIVRYRGAGDDAFRSAPLLRASGDVWTVTLEPWAGRGNRVAYFVEATDGNGEGPSRQGDARRPFTVAVEPAGVSATATTQGHGGLLRGSLSWLAGVAGAFLLVFRRKRRRDLAAERAFWRHALEPIAALPSRERLPALDAFCGRVHVHPIRGHVRLDRVEARREFKARWPELSLKAIAFLAATESMDASARPGARDRFGNRRGATSRPAPAAAGRSASRASRGTSLIELLVVVAVLAGVLVVGALALRPTDRPVELVADELESLLAHSRATAIARSRVVRVRPIDAGRLTVESGASCSGGSWQTVPRLGFELPWEVSLADTGWTACFTSRGISDDNFVITLEHPARPPRSLEVLAGGAVRRLD